MSSRLDKGREPRYRGAPTGHREMLLTTAAVPGPGMVVAQLGVGATDPLARMRAYGFVGQRLLSDVAHDVVTRRLRLTRGVV